MTIAGSRNDQSRSYERTRTEGNKNKSRILPDPTARQVECAKRRLRALLTHVKGAYPFFCDLDNLPKVLVESGDVFSRGNDLGNTFHEKANTIWVALSQLMVADEFQVEANTSGQLVLMSAACQSRKEHKDRFVHRKQVLRPAFR